MTGAGAGVQLLLQELVRVTLFLTSLFGVVLLSLALSLQLEWTNVYGMPFPNLFCMINHLQDGAEEYHLASKIFKGKPPFNKWFLKPLDCEAFHISE